MEKMAITEEMHLEKEWFEEARKQTTETLMDFINHVMNDYIHDYGTVCHAISACAIAAAWSANHSDGACGGITGFQAEFIMWDFIRHWNYPDNECGMRLLDFDNMLYPQYEYNLDKMINKDTWQRIQGKAAKELREKDEYVHPSVVEHWKSIVDGKVPFGYRVGEE